MATDVIPKTTRRRRKRVLPRSRWQRFLIRYGWLLPVLAILIGGSVLLLTYAFASIPLPGDVKLSESAKVYDRNNKLIGTFTGEVTRWILTEEQLAELPEYIGQAVIAAEDRDFYEHNGVSFRGIVRAAWANFTGGAIQQGGSTITQQYVKNAVLQDPSRTVTRKVKEAILAIKLERRYSKDEILGFYLNTIYLGRGAYGFEAAAQAYFNKHARELTLGEAAYLASIVPSPEEYQPDEEPEAARDRRDMVLNRMVEQGFVGEEEAVEASRGKVKLKKKAEAELKRQKAAYFIEWIRKQYLYPEFGDELYTGGLKIYTTLDLDMQAAAENAVSSILPNPEDPQAAIVSMSPQGEVRALVGGKDFTNVRKARGFNYAVDPPGREPGSAMKPFTLLTAIKQGISPQSTFSGYSPMQIEDEECAGPSEDDPLVLEPWEVENFGGASYGTLTLDQATTNSVNTVYAQLVAEVGAENLVKTLDAFEFDREGTRYERTVEANCSLTLGVLDVTPLEMARGFAGFSARGKLPDVTPIRYVMNGEGCLKEYRPEKKDCEEEANGGGEQVADPDDVDVLTQTLTHVVEGGTATAANIGRPVAGKTGTTQNHKDAWFAGYVPQLTTVVWMGYPIEKPKKGEEFQPVMEYCEDPVRCRPVSGDLGYPIAVTGGSFPARIWAAFMTEATEGMEIAPFPEPTELPDEILNSPAPAPTTFAPEPTTEPSPTVSESPTEPPTPSPSPSPSPSPTIVPTNEPSPSPSRTKEKKD